MDAALQALLRRLDHLSEQFRELREGVQKAVRIADEDPEMALTRARKVLEYVVREVYERRIQEPPGTRPLESLLQRLAKDGHFPPLLEAYANTVRMLGNVGTHKFGENVTAAAVYQSLAQLMPILEWYFEEEHPEALAQRPTPERPPEPARPEALLAGVPEHCEIVAAPVALRLAVSRWDGGGYVPLAAGRPQPRGPARDLKKVPPPERIGLRTGDRVRVEVAADRDGFLTVFNVGPTGHLNLLYPDPAAPPAPTRAGHTLHVVDVALTPPPGSERLFAVWSRVPLSLEKAVELTRDNGGAVPPSYPATRNMERVQESAQQQLRRDDWHAVVLELDHV
jgi:hypothetical protein